MKIPLPVSRRRARIEIIPLIDIVFFLLATFVMVSLSLVKNQGIAVNLPSSSTGASQDRSGYTVISITQRGEIYFDKQRVTEAQLTGRLRALKASNPDPKVFLNGDEQASLGTTVRVLDEARKQGITKISIQTAPEKGKP